ncbi:sigma class glutathione-s-transferase 2 [Apostichopus japonicus]|uniref:Sigma class glutathione-s-transferase 2 n=1 Tax=Stichopus japonicus TaxID=307972 RepID=A0A2G8K1I8_STIJA|nr:sigma class glutathione-s-transferase 2 [Apostichopus japonicus]
MPTYKLTYFNVKGRAEPTRYMFALAGVDYEDERIGGDKWKALKSTLPLGQMPLLYVDGKVFPQSNAIHRYVASELGFYGDTALERLEVDVIMETGLELSPKVAGIFAESDDAKKAELKKQLKEEHIPKTLEKLEKLLKENNGGKGWFVRDKITVADIGVFNMFFDFLPVVLGEQIDLSKFACVKGVIDRLAAEPKIKNWIDTRPKTTM